VEATSLKYDDASWHFGGDFPPGSPKEFGGTHIGLFLRFCFTKGWAGELHTEEEPDAVKAVIQGEMTGTDFLFQYCDGKLTDEDFTNEGNAIAIEYYGDKGHYLNDYTENFGDLMYTAPESEHDFKRYSQMFETRLKSGELSS
jgi:hypothetical protein